MKTKRKTLKTVLVFLIVFLIAFSFFVPVYWMIISSLKDNRDIFKYPPDLFFYKPIWSNYINMMKYIPFEKYFFNTFIVTVFSTFGLLVSCPPVAYAFAKLHWHGKNAMFIIVLSTMMLPFQVQMIPLYTLFRNIGWIGTFLPLIIPNFFATAMYIFLLRQFMAGIPKELSESAFIDGANHFVVLFRIVLPLTGPALFSVALFAFLANWTDFLGPLIFLNKQDLFTLSIGLTQFISGHKTEWAYMMAACTLFVLPVVILFFFAQKRFVEGIAFTGIKG
jgi:multiple sugar transport system permease protein